MGKNPAETLPVQEVVANREVGFVADLVEVDHEHHKPASAVAKDVGTIEQLAGAGGEDDAMFVGSFHLLVQLAHEPAGNEAGFARARERNNGGALGMGWESGGAD
jgi:hypothetical protein